jgi:hypothetical protein
MSFASLANQGGKGREEYFQDLNGLGFAAAEQDANPWFDSDLTG